MDLLRTIDWKFHNKENTDAHHTRDYDMEELILRRGQAFDLTVFFDRPYNEDNDEIILQFVTGKYTLKIIRGIDRRMESFM